MHPMPMMTGSVPAALLGGSLSNGATAMKDVSPRKALAMGDSTTGAFQPMAGGLVVHPDSGMDTGKTMAEPNRAIPAPKLSGPGRMATMQPADHGPHHHNPTFRGAK